MVVEDDERERFLDSVGPKLAHVMVIAIIKEVDWDCFRAVANAIAGFNAAGTAFGVVD